MKFPFYIMCILLLSSLTFQNEGFKWKGNYHLVEMDILGNPILANGHILEKYDSHGELINTYNQASNGEITDMDASDALQILLYYADFQNIMLLNSDLSPLTNLIQLSELEFENTSLVCSSFNKGFWLWDDVAASFIRVDNRLKEVQRTSNVHALIGMEISPVKMREGNQYLVVLDAEEGFFLFDIYGAYIKRIPFAGVKDFQLTKDALLFLKDNKIFSYQLETRQQKSKALPVLAVQSFNYLDNVIVVQDSNSQVTMMPFLF